MPLPSDISGLQLWLDADDAASITEDGNGVSQWADKSAAGNTVIQPTNALKPATVAAELNGRTVMRFSSDSLYRLNANLTNLIGSSTCTFYCLFKQTTYGASRGIVTIFASAQAAWSLLPSSTTMRWWLESTSQVAISQLALATAGTWQTAKGVANGSTNTLYYDGSSHSTSFSTVIRSTSTANLRVGGYSDNSTYIGDIAEVIFYNRLLTSGEQTDVKSYINSKWFASFQPWFYQPDATRFDQ